MMKKQMIIQKLRGLLRKVKMKAHSKKKSKRSFIKNIQASNHGQLLQNPNNLSHFLLNFNLVLKSIQIFLKTFKINSIKLVDRNLLNLILILNLIQNQYILCKRFKKENRRRRIKSKRIMRIRKLTLILLGLRNKYRVRKRRKLKKRRRILEILINLMLLNFDF